MKDSFILRTSWQSVFDDLGDKQAGVLIKAVFNYMATGEKPTMQSDLEIKMAFKFISIDLDKFNESYEKRCETNRENGMKGADFGKLGGRPRKQEKPPKTPNGDKETPKTPYNDMIRYECDLNPPSIPPNGGNEEEVEILKYDSLKLPDDGVNRNYKGLLDNLRFFCCSDDEIKQIIVASNFGEIGHKVWKIFKEINSGIKIPGKFILSRL